MRLYWPKPPFRQRTIEETEREFLAFEVPGHYYYRFSSELLSRLREAHSRGYLVYSQLEEALECAWDNWCSMAGIPRVVVKKAPKYTAIKYDFAALPRKITHEALVKVGELFMRESVRKRPPEPIYSTFAYVTRIPSERAEAVAAELVTILRVHEVPVSAPATDPGFIGPVHEQRAS